MEALEQHPCIPIIYSVFVTANTENRWRTVRTFKAADRHEHGHLDRCTPSGAALAERAERTDRAHPRRRPYDVLHVPSRLLPARAPWIICGKNRRWG